MQVAYFDQMREQLDEEKSVAETISPGSDWIEIGSTRQHVMTYLADFLFPPQRANSPVKALSGGERNRLLLARLFARSANVLVMDEPTNDLDIDSLELLESTLQTYAGTLLLVSHDRAFLDNVVTQTLVAEGGGKWQEYVGGYTDWLAQRPSQPARTAAPRTKPSRSLRRLAPGAPVEVELQGNARTDPAARRNRGARTGTTGAHCENEQRRLSQAGRRADEGGRATRGRTSSGEMAEKFERWSALEAKATLTRQAVTEKSRGSRTPRKSHQEQRRLDTAPLLGRGGRLSRLAGLLFPSARRDLP